MNEYDELYEIIKKSKNIVLFTGAGISCPSGIPDFRGDKGLYSEKTESRIAPEKIISHSFFMENPKTFYDFYFKKMIYPNATPNVCHKYFGNLSNLSCVVTQNIDGLHQKSTTKPVYELHGSVYRNYCMKCHKFYAIDDISKDGVPHCSCGGIIKPDVVLYEEELDIMVVQKAIKAIATCDTLIVIGTSLTVYPTASYIRFFKGEHVVLINKGTTCYESDADLVIDDDCAHVALEMIKREDK